MTATGLILTTLSICGCWRPLSCSNSFYKRFLYNLYTIFVMFHIITLSISQAIFIGLNSDNMSDMSDDIYVLLEESISGFKMSTLLINSKDIVKLMDLLTQDPLKPLDDEEKKIQAKFDKMLWYSAISYMCMVEVSVASFIFLSLITDFGKRELMFRAWLPFDITPSYIFYITYVHQVFALMVAAMLNVSLDTLICSFLIQICCQIKILEYRFTKITNKRKAIVKLCVHQHESIYKYAATVNQIFQLIIFVQIFVSTSTICFTLHQLAKASTNISEFIRASLYMMCMLMQVFFYCWYGNLVTLKSQDIGNQIYNINWPDFDVNIRKSLLVIMNRTVIPITLVPMNILPINLQLFVSILKTAYSAYNILQQTQK